MKKSTSTKATAILLAVFLSAVFSFGTVSSSDAAWVNSIKDRVREASKAKVVVNDHRTCTPGTKQVAFYEHRNYKGKCSVRGIGQYRTPKEIGMANDSISSVKVGSQVKVALCKDHYF